MSHRFSKLPWRSISVLPEKMLKMSHLKYFRVQRNAVSRAVYSRELRVERARPRVYLDNLIAE